MIETRRFAGFLRVCRHPWAAYTRARTLRLAVHRAAELVAQTFGENLKIEPVETFFGTTVHCRILGQAGRIIPASLLIKRSKAKKAGQKFDPEEPDPQGMAFRLFNDWSGMEFLAGICKDSGSIAPVCWGGDRNLGLVLVEHCGEIGLDKVLRTGPAAAAAAALVETSDLLGTMHAASLGRDEELASIRRRLGPAARSLEEVSGSGEWFARQLARAEANIAALGCEIGPASRRILAGVAERIANPGILSVYTHGDLCPDNVRLAVGRRPYLIDFEYGAFRHALTDGVFGRMMFPTCWKVLRLPPDVALRMEHAYRSALAAGIPAVEEDAFFHRALLDACIYWLIVRLAVALRAPQGKNDRLSALAEDKDWGLSSLRQIVLARLTSCLETAGSLGLDPPLQETFARLRDRLAQAWGPVEEMPLFPAFAA